MNNLSVGTRLITGFIVVSLLTLVTAGIGLFALDRNAEALHSINDDLLPAIQHMYEIELELKNVAESQRMMMLDILTPAQRSKEH